MTIPAYYYDQKLISLIEDYIFDGCISYDALSEHQILMLISIVMDIFGDDAYEAITESDNLQLMLRYFKMYLKTAKREYALDMAEIMVQNASEYFKDNLSALYAEVFAQHKPSLMAAA